MYLELLLSTWGKNRNWGWLRRWRWCECQCLRGRNCQEGNITRTRDNQGNMSSTITITSCERMRERGHMRHLCMHSWGTQTAALSQELMAIRRQENLRKVRRMIPKDVVYKLDVLGWNVNQSFSLGSKVVMNFRDLWTSKQFAVYQKVLRSVKLATRESEILR
jgi:hypothetical protein